MRTWLTVIAHKYCLLLRPQVVPYIPYLAGQVLYFPEVYLAKCGGKAATIQHIHEVCYVENTELPFSSFELLQTSTQAGAVFA